MTTIEATKIRKAYSRLAPIYDYTFVWIFKSGRSLVVKEADIPGARILEIGVGTGISLPEYTHAKEIVGIDFSGPMLTKAKKLVAERGLSRKVTLQLMDAMELEFPDGSFDVIVAAYLITTVENPEKCLEECYVC